MHTYKVTKASYLISHSRIKKILPRQLAYTKDLAWEVESFGLCATVLTDRRCIHTLVTTV